jgi:hypothetical protein
MFVVEKGLKAPKFHHNEIEVQNNHLNFMMMEFGVQNDHLASTN